MKFYYPKVSVGSIKATRPTRSFNPFSTTKVTLRVPVLKAPKLPFRIRNPFTKA